jgi:benzylsuccinate CoA-transferase BbsF subunit
MLTMPVMGTTGPQRNFGAIGNNVIALGGINYAMGFPGTPPTGMGPLYSDFAAPYFAASAILAALYHRDQTGEGQFIDLAQFQATASLLGPALLDYSANNIVPERPGNTHPDFAPHGVYPCAPAPHSTDRWLALSIEDDSTWQRFIKLVNDSTLFDKSKFGSNDLRKTNETLLNATIARYTVTRDAWSLTEFLQDEGITAGVAQDLSDVLDRDPGLRTQHFEDLTDRAGRVTYTTHRQPVRINGQTASMGRPPLFGEHNYEVYTDLLGYSDIEYAELVATGIVN